MNESKRTWPLSRGVAVLGLWAGLLLTGCVSTEHQSRDWSQYDGPGARYFQAPEVTFPYELDPLEPVNRAGAMANYAALRWVVHPLAKGYRFVVPRFFRKRLAKATTHLAFPRRFLTNALQGKLGEAGVEASRFAINSTVGLLGFYDPAQHWGLHPFPEDFGQTFAHWGWKDSTYLFLPFLGPSTVRDGIGKAPDFLSDPPTYFFPATYALGFNSLSNHIAEDLRQIHSSYDAYEPGRTLFSLQRVVSVEDLEWHQDQSAPTQTLSAIFLVPDDPRFAERALERKAHIAELHKDLPYSLWIQPQPAPLLYVIPGVGANRLSPSALALAEIGYAQGLSVVAVSNPTNFEFMRHGASVSVPGFGPVDTRDLHVALSAIDADLNARYPGRFSKRAVMGLSLGAYQALGMTLEGATPAEGSGGEPLVDFDLCLALNPPVDFERALQQLDEFYNAPLAFPAEERDQRIEEIYAKVLYLSHGDLQPGEPLPFTSLEAEFLIGLAFRLDLQYMILQSQDLEDSGMLLTRRTRWHKAPAFREAAEFSFMEYVYGFLLPYYAQPERQTEFGIEFSEEGARQLFEQSSLRALGPRLQSDERLRVFTNQNDFLLRAADLEWLKTTFGERLTLFEDGGHLGNLYRDYIQQQIAEVLSEEAP